MCMSTVIFVPSFACSNILYVVCRKSSDVIDIRHCPMSRLPFTTIQTFSLGTLF